MDGIQKPRVSPPWTCEWDTERETWPSTNEETDERTYLYNYDRMAISQGKVWRDNDRDNDGSYAETYATNAQQALSNVSQSIQETPESVAYDVGAAVDRADKYQHEAKGVADRLATRATNWLSGAREDVHAGVEDGVEQVADAPKHAMASIGEGVGHVGRFGEYAGQAIVDAPYDAMRKVGEGVEDVQEAGENVKQYGDTLGDAYEQGKDQDQCD